MSKSQEMYFSAFKFLQTINCFPSIKFFRQNESIKSSRVNVLSSRIHWPVAYWLIIIRRKNA